MTQNKFNPEDVRDVFNYHCTQLGIDASPEEYHKFLLRIAELQTLKVFDVLPPLVSSKESQGEESEVNQTPAVNILSASTDEIGGTIIQLHIGSQTWAKLLMIVGSEYRGIEWAISSAIKDWVTLNSKPNSGTHIPQNINLNPGLGRH